MDESLQASRFHALIRPFCVVLVDVAMPGGRKLLGLRAGMKRQYELSDLPAKEDVIERAEPWRPFRSIATWFFWRSFGNVRQSS